MKFNPVYNIFLSDDFERYKSEYLKNKTISDKISRLKEYFPSFFKFRYVSNLIFKLNFNLKQDNKIRFTRRFFSGSGKGQSNAPLQGNFGHSENNRKHN